MWKRATHLLNRIPRGKSCPIHADGWTYSTPVTSIRVPSYKQVHKHCYIKMHAVLADLKKANNEVWREELWEATETGVDHGFGDLLREPYTRHMGCVYVEMMRSDRGEATCQWSRLPVRQVVPGSLLHQTFVGTLHSDHFWEEVRLDWCRGRGAQFSPESSLRKLHWISLVAVEE